MIDSLEHNPNNLNMDTISRIANSISLNDIIENVKIFLYYIEKHKSKRIYLCPTFARTVLEYTQVRHFNHIGSFKGYSQAIIN